MKHTLARRISAMSLCAKLSVISIAAALIAALGVGLWTGERGAFFLAGAVLLLGSTVGLLNMFFSRSEKQDSNTNADGTHAAR